MKPVQSFLALLCASVLTGCATHATKQRVMLPDAQRVLFLGDSITYAGQYVEDIEAYFATRFPKRRIEILNLGLPSETVSGLSEPNHADGKFPRPDLHERLDRVLKMTKPDVVIACYGMNDGIYLPFSSNRFAAFTNGLVRLRAKAIGSGARIIHVTPPTFDEQRAKGMNYSSTLDRYSEWMLEQRAAGWKIIDVHGAMNQSLTEGRRTNANFHLSGDGVHPGVAGHWLMAKEILISLGARDLDSVNDANEMTRVSPNGTAVLKLVQQKQRMLKDAWLTETGHQRPGMNKGLPLAEATTKAAELDQQIRNLGKAAITSP